MNPVIAVKFRDPDMQNAWEKFEADQREASQHPDPEQEAERRRRLLKWVATRTGPGS